MNNGSSWRPPRRMPRSDSRGRPLSTTSSAVIARTRSRPGCETRGVATPWELAPTFVSAGVDIPWLEELAAKLPPESHAEALGWLEARLNLKLLLEPGRAEHRAHRRIGQSREILFLHGPIAHAGGGHP